MEDGESPYVTDVNIEELVNISDSNRIIVRNNFISEIPENTVLDSAYLELLYIQHDPDKLYIDRALEIVHRYIIDRSLILVGGMAIHYALQAKGSQLYSTNKIDYDFYSYSFHSDAYNIAKLIVGKSETSTAQVFNGLHPSTMRVRYRMNIVADSTYIPKVIFDRIPTMVANNMIICHPYYQVLDQHLALSRPYEGFPQENVSGKRWKNDIARFEMLIDHYDLADDIRKTIYQGKSKVSKLFTKKVDISTLHDNCIAGYAAYAYWMNKSGSNKFNFDLVDDTITYTTSSNVFTIYSDKFPDVDKDAKWYNAFLDKLPRKVMTDELEIYDNYGYLTSAHKLNDNIYVIGIQSVLLYMSIRATFYNDADAVNAYENLINLMIRSVKEGSSQYVYELTYYGSLNISVSDIISMTRLNNMRHKKEMHKIDLPPHYTSNNINIPEYDPTTSREFQFDAEECEPFEQDDFISYI